MIVSVLVIFHVLRLATSCVLSLSMVVLTMEFFLPSRRNPRLRSALCGAMEFVRKGMRLKTHITVSRTVTGYRACRANVLTGPFFRRELTAEWRQ